MSFGRTLLFIVLFSVVMGIYLYQGRLQKQMLVNIPDEVNRNVVFEKDDKIVRLEILDHNRNLEIELLEHDGNWLLESPVRYAADSSTVEGLLMTVRWISKQPRLHAEKDWQEYGLAKPALEVLVGVSGKKDERLLMGTEAPIGKSVFVRWDSERGYFLIPAEAQASFQQSVYSLREKRLFRMRAGEYSKIYVEMGKNHYQWKKEGGDWYWMEPLSKFGQKIPPERMQLIINALQNLHIRDYLDDNQKSRAELGFFIIQDRIWIESDSGKKEVFCFGNEVSEKNAYYGFREKEDVIFLVDRGKIFELLDMLQAIEKGKILTTEKVSL